MSDLHVNLSALRVTERRLGQVEQELQGCSRAVRGAGRTDLGAAQLDAACEHFADSWFHGTEQRGRAASTVRQQLTKGLRVYVDADDALAAIVSR